MAKVEEGKGVEASRGVGVVWRERGWGSGSGLEGKGVGEWEWFGSQTDAIVSTADLKAVAVNRSYDVDAPERGMRF